MLAGEILLSNGADINQTTSNDPRGSILRRAADQSNKLAIEPLLQHGADIEISDTAETSPVRARIYGDETIPKLLLETREARKAA